MARPAPVPLDRAEPFVIDVPHPRPVREKPTLPAPLDFPTIFGNANPVEIEVGFGKGLFLLGETLARPEVNFLGVEIERKYVLFTANKLFQAPRPNVKLACTEACWLFAAGFVERSIQAVHVYFPDPWWKQKHRKRKLFTPEFAQQVARILKPGGKLYFLTDVEAYFQKSMTMMCKLDLLTTLPLPELRVAAPTGSVTNFERKYREEGRPIWQAEFQKANEPET